MKKIPTIFERDREGDRSRVLNVPHPEYLWVFNGEGVPSRKLDGMCCMIRDGKLYKRREIKGSKVSPIAAEFERPEGFELADFDKETGKIVGWMPVRDGPDDQYFREAFGEGAQPNGTYELIGKKVQGGAEKDLWEKFDPPHMLVAHNDPSLILQESFPRTYDGIKGYFAGKDIEGVVFQHPDGRLAKIKLRDFGLKRGVSPKEGAKR